MLIPSNCIHHLFPTPRGTEIRSLRRRATAHPRPRNRTTATNLSFITPSKNRLIFILRISVPSVNVIYFILSLLVLSCVVLLYYCSYPLDFQPSGCKYNKPESDSEYNHGILQIQRNAEFFVFFLFFRRITTSLIIVCMKFIFCICI